MPDHYTEKDRDKVRTLYAQGKSIAEISRIRGLPTDPKTIRRWLTDMGVTLRGPSDLRTHPREKILKELKAKVTRTKIQKKYGCSAKYLSLLASGKLVP